MLTLKKGSKGINVEKLLKLLKITIDSNFGPKTEEAVKKFLKEHKLDADGIVGPKTWAALGVTTEPVNNSKVVDSSVIYSPTTCVTKTPNRTIKYIAIHYTAGASSAPGRALHMKDSWEKTRRASADFGVDDTTMVQFNPDLLNYKCWSVGDKKNPYSGGGSLYGIATNGNTISIEICSNLKKGYSGKYPNHDGWYFTDKALENGIRLIKILMKKFNIPANRVVRHYDISGKICPGIEGWNNATLYDNEGKALKIKNNSKKWEEFKKKLI